jgi:hypothetical protein
MRKLLVVTAVLIAGSVAAGLASRKRRARLKDRLLSAIEACPPTAKVSALQQQSDDVIGLLREQNELLRQGVPVGGLPLEQPA